MMKSKWMARFCKDFTQKEFIPLKILFFFLYGGMSTLFPFITIQARSIGITAEELGLMHSLLPVTGVLAPAIAGMLGDKIGNFRVYLAVMVSLSGLASLLFLAVPIGRAHHQLPKELPLTLKCTENSTDITINPPFQCDYRTTVNRTDISVNSCVFTCSDESEPSLSFSGLDQTWCSVTKNCNLLRSKDEERETGLIANTTKLKSEDFLLMEVQKNKTGSTTELQLMNNFCPDVQQLLERNPAYYFNGNDFTTTTTKPTECWLRCDATVDSQILCENTVSVEVFRPWVTLASYVVVRLFNAFTLTTSIPLFEGAVVAIVKEHKGDFGYQRIYGNLGLIVMTPISGKLIDVFSEKQGREDFTPAFYMYCALKFICSIIILFINLDFKKPSNTVVKDFKELIVHPRVSCFMMFIFVSGTCYGFVETFVFWLLEDLGADKSLMGLTVTAGAVFGIPLLLISTYIIKRCGHIGTMCIAIAFFVVRLVGYSFITNPWEAIPFEAMESFTNSLMSVVACSYCAILSTASTVASLQGIYMGTYHGVGRASGSLIGGFMIKNVGIRATMQFLAAVCAVTCVVYYSVYWFIFRKTDQAKEKEVMDKENVKQTEDAGDEVQEKNHEYVEDKVSSTPEVRDLPTTGGQQPSNGFTNLAYKKC